MCILLTVLSTFAVMAVNLMLQNRLAGGFNTGFIVLTVFSWLNYVRMYRK